MPRGKKFTTGKIDETLEALNSVTPKQKTTVNLKELIRGLKPKIKRLRSWGYEWHEIVELLKQQGIEIAEHTLKQYLSSHRRKKEKHAQQETLSSELNNSKKGKQVKNNASEFQQVRTDKLHKDSEELKQGKTDKFHKDDSDRTTSTESVPESSGYQPIKLTMRK